MARRRREWLGQFEAAVARRLKREEFYIPYCLATTDWNGAKLFCGSFPGKGKRGKGGKAEAKLWDGDEVRHDNDQDGQDQEAIL